MAKMSRPPRRSGRLLVPLAALVLSVGATAAVSAAIAIRRRLARGPAGQAKGMLKYYAFRVASVIVPRLPARLLYRAAWPAGWLCYILAPSLRSRARRNLRHVPALAADPYALERAVRGVFRCLILNYLDFLRAGHLSDAEIQAHCQVPNLEAFRSLVAEGRGVVLLVAHTSGFELAAARLAALGYPVVIPAERLQPDALFTFFCRSRERLGMRFLPADSRETLHEMMNVLRSGGVLVFAVDRWITGTSVELPLFGEPVKMPITPAALAARLGARVGVALAYHPRRHPERTEVLFVPLEADAQMTETTDTTEVGMRLQRRFLSELERFLTAHPEQWVSALWPVWDA